MREFERERPLQPVDQIDQDMQIADMIGIPSFRVSNGI